MVRSLRVALMGAALWVTSISSTVYAATAPAHYSIAGQDLGQALIELAQTANRNITFAPDVVRGRTTVGVTSAENFEAALGALLVNSGLTYRIESDGSATVYRAPPTPGQPTPAPSIAQAAQNQGTNQLQELVVTGVANAKGERKQDAPFAITTISEEQLLDAAPTSTANVTKLVPGLWAETTGGQSGPNVEVRGFPTGSDAPFVTYQIDGLPIYPTSTLSFLDNSTQIRLDDTVANFEGTIGGPAVLWGAAQPGATMNLTQKNGLDNPGGVLRYTGGSGALERVDGYYGGKIADSWYASLGGFYTTQQGVRNTQYPSDQGYQLGGTATHVLDDGKLQAYFRVTNTNTQFFTPLPLQASGTGSNLTIAPLPGFNPLTATFFSNANRFVTFDTNPGQSVTMDEARGRGVDTHLFGLDYDKSWNGLDFSNKLSYYGGTTYSLTQFTGNLPETLGQFITDAINGGGVNSLPGANKTVPLSATGGVLATAGTAYNTSTGQAITDLSQQVIGVGNWYVKKDITAFQDEGRVGLDLVQGDRLTVGFYVAHFTSHDVWYLGNQSLLPLQTNPTAIGVTLNNGVRVTSSEGIFSPVNTSVNNFYTGDKRAGIINDEWHITDKLTIDAGYRLQYDTINATLANTAKGLTTTNPLNLYDYGANVLTGADTGFSHSWWGHAISASTDYEIQQNLNAFVSYNQGFVMPTFDDIRNNKGNPNEAITHMKQVQGGIKTSQDWVTAYVDGFYANFTGQPQSLILANGTVINYLLSSGSEGAEFDLTLHPFRNDATLLKGLELSFTGDYENGSYTAGGPGITGNQIVKQPPFQFRLTPSYSVDTGFGRLKLYATTTYAGDRWADLQNTRFLPSYWTEDVGASFYMANGLELRVTGTNVTNTLAITEGNSRVLGNGIVSNVLLARPLFGATYEASVAIHF
jgi:iron complex outermembrane recepter protein